MLAFCCRSFRISLSLVCWFSLGKPCNSGCLSSAQNVLPISLSAPDLMLCLVKFGTSSIDLLLLHQQVDLLLNPLQVLIELGLNLYHCLSLNLVILGRLDGCRSENSPLVALRALASLHCDMTARFACPVCALLLAHLVLSNIC